MLTTAKRRHVVFWSQYQAACGKAVRRPTVRFWRILMGRTVWWRGIKSGWVLPVLGLALHYLRKGRRDEILADQ